MAVSVECCCSKLQPSLSVHSLGLCHRPVGSYSLLGLLSPCFPRPRFELGLSSRVPQVSAKRARLSCPIRPWLLDHPSQRSQSWPVNTISIIAIRRMTRFCRDLFAKLPQQNCHTTTSTPPSIMNKLGSIIGTIIGGNAGYAFTNWQRSRFELAAPLHRHFSRAPNTD